ncbi:hypothetical protein BVY01_02200 [bacterium I07]|nr:hypothetical protein BVY01_02200 [bacterium I07]
MRNLYVSIFSIIVMNFYPPTFAADQIPAFPGAEGFGTFTKGGRGGRVIQITTLQDYDPSKDKVVPGSLRAALSEKGPRIIIFRIGGNIDLKAPLVLTEPYCTIAGQTAPGDGICIKNYQLSIHSHDVVIRYMRFRPGPGPHYDYEHHSIETRGCRNLVLDHCSLSWATDEVLTLVRSSDVTVQWCIIAEGLNISTHAEGAHSKGTMVSNGSTRTTHHHNLLAHNYDRNPLIFTKREELKEIIVNDVRNNVVYNASEADINGRFNFVGNLYIQGPNFRNMYCLNAVEPNEFYAHDNIGPRRISSKMPNDNAFRSSGEVNLVDEPFKMPEVTTHPVDKILNMVLEIAGATRPKRDGVDKRIVSDVTNRMGKIIDDPAQVGGWPNLQTGDPYPDSNKNGMSDDWEKRYGIDPGDTNSGNQDPDNDGYTNIEEFLNGTHPFAKGI